jgi:hypothetical protein
MTSRDLESVALTLVAEGKGILAADDRHPRDPVDRAKPAHLSGNALYIPWRRRVYQRCDNV